ncbi:MAG: hypothetical protein EOO42_17295, partial [Flavobacteriales bacterium]
MYSLIGGQQVLSPYHAMACNPAIMVDPFGLRSAVFDNGASHPNPPVDPLAYAKAMFPTMHRYVPGGDLFNAGNFSRNSMMDDTYTAIVLGRFFAAWGESRAQSAANNTSSSDAGSGKQQASEELKIPANGTNYRITYDGGMKLSEIMEAVSVIDKKADWADWGKRMNTRYGSSLGYGFEGYGLQQIEGKIYPYIAVEAEFTAGLYFSNNTYTVGLVNNVYHDIVISNRGNSYNKGIEKYVAKTKWIDVGYAWNASSGVQYKLYSNGYDKVGNRVFNNVL